MNLGFLTCCYSISCNTWTFFNYTWIQRLQPLYFFTLSQTYRWVPVVPVLTDVLVSLYLLQDAPLLVITVVSSLGVGLEFFDGGDGGSPGADPVNGGRDSLSQPGLHGPDLPVDLKEHRLHALVHTTVWSLLSSELWSGDSSAVSHREVTGGGRRLNDRREQLLQQEHSQTRPRIGPRTGQGRNNSTEVVGKTLKPSSEQSSSNKRTF